MKSKHIIILTILILFFTTFFISLKQLSKKDLSTEISKDVFVSTQGVCPPFYLLTEDGDTINPITGKNTDKPYSPKQTCGNCHDYDKITEGFHFQQGMNENPDSIQVSRAQWVLHPGNYGGNWCSPAPLYSYLSAKENQYEQLIDLTSYTFVSKCGICHPGGGSLEFDRNGKRYDKVMTDTSYGYKDGEKNNLDGDYYKARWQASGVIEADCFMCHLPQYNNKVRVQQIQKLNYRYAALAASGFGIVNGSVAENTPISIEYNKEMFMPDGTVEPNIIKEPRNTACLWCHAKPGYKKRGANFNARNDVHIRAGLKCVDCHPAGSMATDKRINERETHQFAKGDDPGGFVRNDLDNTMRTCADCHDNGYLGAPLAKHTWLPDFHLEKIACQTCHIPERYVKSAHYVASDVFNPGTKIPDKGKYLWTFYGPDMNYWNHYGDLEMMGFDDKPTFNFKPELVKYKGQIFPVNRIHTSWPGILTEGEKGLMQPKMSDMYKMWMTHKKDNSKYPELAKITDDNRDEVIEVNRPEEIDALIISVTKMLEDIEYPMVGKQVVWVMNNRVYKSADDNFELPMSEWEASPYGNVHKYNHDILPAKAALGANSCTDCHSFNSSFFYAKVLKYPVGNDGNPVPVYVAQYEYLGMSYFFVWLSTFRENYLKTMLYPVFILLILFVLLAIILAINKQYKYFEINKTFLAIIFLMVTGAFLLVWLKPDVHSYVLPDRLWFDKSHFMISMLALLIIVWSFLTMRKYNKNWDFLMYIQFVFIVLAIIAGGFMMIKFDAIESIVKIAYTLFDFAIVAGILTSIIYIVKKQFNAFIAE